MQAKVIHARVLEVQARRMRSKSSPVQMEIEKQRDDASSAGRW